LTKKGYSRSKWDLPDFFKNVSISYHSKNSWEKDYFQSAHIGQEFVVEDSKSEYNTKVENWAKRIINKNEVI